MLTLTILVPLIGALAILYVNEDRCRKVACVLGAIPLLLLIIAWIGFDTGAGAPVFQWVESYPWIPSLGVGWASMSSMDSAGQKGQVSESGKPALPSRTCDKLPHRARCRLSGP